MSTNVLTTKPTRRRPKHLPAEQRDDVRARILRAKLSDRDRFIIESYYGLDRDRLSMAEIAEHLGISASMIGRSKVAIWDRLAQLWD